MIGDMWWMLLALLFALSAVMRHDVLLFFTLLLALASGAILRDRPPDTAREGFKSIYLSPNLRDSYQEFLHILNCRSHFL